MDKFEFFLIFRIYNYRVHNYSRSKDCMLNLRKSPPKDQKSQNEKTAVLRLPFFRFVLKSGIRHQTTHYTPNTLGSHIVISGNSIIKINANTIAK